MAGRIPQSFINDLLARIDIVELIDDRLTLRKAGRNYQALCPFHEEKTPSFSVNPEKQFYYCFGCGASGTAITFLLEHDRLDFVSAVETLAARAGLEVPRERGGRSAPESDERPLYALMERAARHFRHCLRHHPERARAVEYLQGRGLTGVTVRDFGLGFAPPGWDGLRKALGDVPAADLVKLGLVIEGDRGRPYDRFRDRIIFPIRDSRGRTIAFGGRVLGDGEPKYLNSPETVLFHKGRELYGLYEARRAVRRLDRLLLVEGYMDVVALAQAGIPNAVATLGTASSERHFERLFRVVPEVVCCFDGDSAGREAAWRALERALPALKEGRQLRFLFLPEGEDPDSLVREGGRAALEARLAGAVSATEFLFQRLTAGLDTSTMDGCARLAELAMPLIRRVPDGVLRELMLQHLAERTGISMDALRRSAGFTGAAAGVSGGASAGADPRRGRRGEGPAASELSPLEEELLAMVVQHPQFFLELDEHRRARLLGLEDSLLVRVLRSLIEQRDEQGEMDTAALLGYWTGAGEHQTLVRLADKRFLLDEDALRNEFTDAVDRYLQRLSKWYRQLLVRDMRDIRDEARSRDALERWQQLIRPSKT